MPKAEDLTGQHTGQPLQPLLDIDYIRTASSGTLRQPHGGLTVFWDFPTTRAGALVGTRLGHGTQYRKDAA